MSTTDVVQSVSIAILIVLFVLQETRQRRNVRICKSASVLFTVDNQLRSQDVLVFENKLMRDILLEVKRCREEGLQLDEELDAAIERILKNE